MRKSGFFNSLWDNGGGPRQLPKGGTRIAMEFSSGFHSESASIEFIYEMLQLTGVQYFS